MQPVSLSHRKIDEFLDVRRDEPRLVYSYGRIISSKVRKIGLSRKETTLQNLCEYDDRSTRLNVPRYHAIPLSVQNNREDTYVHRQYRDDTVPTNNGTCFRG
jgi:hypothetical protein